jgi:hypothetical protein
LASSKRWMTSLKLPPGCFAARSLRYTPSLKEIVLTPIGFA